MSAPWNKGVTLKWTCIHNGDPSTFPAPWQKVLAVDLYSNQAVCFYDPITQDFLLSFAGLDASEVISHILDQAKKAFVLNGESIYAGIEMTDKDGGLSDIGYEISEDLQNIIEDGEPVAFCGVECWMPLPPAPTTLIGEEGEDEVTFLTYDLFSAIEPSIRAAIKDVIARQTPGEQS